MFSAEALQVGSVCQAAGIVGDGVVDIAKLGGPVAAYEPAGEIAAAHEVHQCRRGPVARFGWTVPGVNEPPYLGGAAGGQVGQYLCRYQRPAQHKTRIGRKTRGRGAGLYGRAGAGGLADELGETFGVAYDFGPAIVGPLTMQVRARGTVESARLGHHMHDK
jgi:hypothetical protein